MIFPSDHNFENGICTECGGHDEVVKDGWVLENGNWYYMDESGAMVTGWLDLNGTWYYLFEDGRMAYGDTIIIDGAAYTFDASGIWVA